MFDWFDPEAIGSTCGAEPIWSPKIQIYNKIGEIVDPGEDESDNDARVHDGSLGLAKITRRVRGSFRAHFKVHDFPFDVHLLPVTLKTRSEKQDLANTKDKRRKYVKMVHGGNIRKGVLESKGDRPGLRACHSFASKADWLEEFNIQETVVSNNHSSDVDDLYFPPTMTQEEVATEKKLLQDRDKYTFGIVVRRDSKNTFLNVFLYLVMIQSLSVLLWGLPPSSLDDRAEIILTILLTIVAFKYVIQDKLPDVPYTTMMDWYLIKCFIFLWALGLTCLLTVWFVDKREDSVDHQVTFWTLTTFQLSSFTTATYIDLSCFCLTIFWLLSAPVMMIRGGQAAQRKSFKRWNQMAANSSRSSKRRIHIDDFKALWNSSNGDDIALSGSHDTGLLRRRRGVSELKKRGSLRFFDFPTDEHELI